MSGVNWTRAELEPERASDRVREQRLGDPRDTLEQDVPAARASAVEQLVDDGVLADDDLADLGDERCP